MVKYACVCIDASQLRGLCRTALSKSCPQYKQPRAISKARAATGSSLSRDSLLASSVTPSHKRSALAGLTVESPATPFPCSDRESWFLSLPAGSRSSELNTTGSVSQAGKQPELVYHSLLTTPLSVSGFYPGWGSLSAPLPALLQVLYNYCVWRISPPSLYGD